MLPIQIDPSPMPEVLPTDTDVQAELAIRRASILLGAGQLVGVPTETVYGLAANAWDRSAVQRIYQVKGRPAHNPLIVHVASLEMARQCAGWWPELADRLARAFWPGPLTLVLPKAESIPDEVTAGGPTVALRWPAHPIMQQLIARCGFPLAAPSANLSNQISPTTAQHVGASLGNRISLVIDGGPAWIGIESTVLDLSVDPPRLLRPGMIAISELRNIAGPVLSPESPPLADGQHSSLRSPGQLRKHYSPKAPLQVRHWKHWEELKQDLLREHPSLEHIHIIAYSHFPVQDFGKVIILPNSPQEYARDLYAALHQCDRPGVELIVAEAVPESPAWDGIRDRLKRAATVPEPGSSQVEGSQSPSQP